MPKSLARRVIAIFLMFVFAANFLAVPKVNAASYTQQDINTINEGINSVNALNNSLQQSDNFLSFIDIFQAQYPGVTQKLDSAISTAKGTGQTDIVEIGNQLQKIEDDIQSVNSYIATADTNADAPQDLRDADAKFIDDLNILYDMVKSAEQKQNEEKKRLSAIYGGLAVAFTTISVLLYLWVIKSKRTEDSNLKEAQLIANARWDLFKVSILPTVCAIGTMLWYISVRNKGGTYYILWWPMLLGSIALIGGARHYRESIKSGAFKAAAEKLEAIRNQSDDDPKTYEENVVVKTTAFGRTKYVSGVLKIDYLKKTLQFPSPKNGSILNLSPSEINTKYGLMGIRSRCMAVRVGRTFYYLIPVGDLVLDEKKLRKAFIGRASPDRKTKLDELKCNLDVFSGNV